MKNYEKNYYLGLDIGTDSVGWAVSDTTYSLLKFHGEPAWGTHIFDEASLSDERRKFRSARRRLDRKKQRTLLLQELFSSEINKIDDCFFRRIKESRLYRNDIGEEFTLFTDNEYTDEHYYKEYPTIHHLICELMQSKEKHDPRLIYLALAWLVSHRGHFLSNISMDRLNEIKDFTNIYTDFMQFFNINGYDAPWGKIDIKELANTLRKKQNITNKTKDLTNILYAGNKPKDEVTDSFPFSRAKIVSLLAGSKVSLVDLFGDDSYAEMKSVSLTMPEEDFVTIVDAIGNDGDILIKLRAIADWTVLVETLGESPTISAAKVAIYEQHKKDLALLKYFTKKYINDEYVHIFREEEKDNYVSYSYHINGKDTRKLSKAKVEDFSKFVLKKFEKVVPDKNDEKKFQDMIERLKLNTFLPKQKTTDNRVIPYQLYYFELIRILENAENYLSFLTLKDEDGINVSEKIKSIFLFRIPYYVGPLNQHSNFAWIERKSDKIYPWNIEKIVDYDASEQNFIQRMTNTCTYIPGETVLPKESLLYHKYAVLNEINNIKINGIKIPVELKQDIYTELFLNVKKVTRKRITDYLISIGVINAKESELVTGIDTTINANLSTNISFKKLIDDGVLTEKDAEAIIERASYSEDKQRLSKWIHKKYPQISDEDVNYLCKLKLKEFGRLSRCFLTEIEGIDKETGEVHTIINALWNTQNNLMELLSDKFTFRENIEKINKEYYSVNKISLDERLGEMRLSGAVKRSVYRTLDVVSDIVKAFGTPEKIFIEMTRGDKQDQKGKRTKSRKQQILDLYAQCKDEDVKLLKKQLEEMGDYADNKLQGDKLFLYYMQFGKSAYSGKAIDIERLGTKLYDIDHIYPQAFVKDDSIINNKVLVLSEENGTKGNRYPVDSSIQSTMVQFWKYLLSVGAMSEEKYNRLTRSTPFSDEEKLGFINRQLTETSQSTKAVGTLLKEKYPNSEIVYVKAKLTAEFRQEFNLYKSRLFNDLHHAADAYLNIVTGNVYDMKFSRQWFKVDSEYSVKTKNLFSRPLICNGRIIWEGEEAIKKVKRIAIKNNAHFTKFAYLKHGGLFDQMPISASDNLIPLKQGLDTKKYGGYNKAGVMFYIPVRYTAGKKTEILILPVEISHGYLFLKDKAYAKEYAIKRAGKILGKKVDNVEFPMGMRPWKVNTVLSLDGFRICIAGTASGGKCLIAQPLMQFSDSDEWRYYIKKLEMYVEKISKNPKYIYNEEFDHISKMKNIELYELYISKYENTVYSKRINSPLEIIRKGKNIFAELSIEEQAKTLLNIHATFGRTSGGCDLQSIGGAAKAAATGSFSSTISNWKKNYEKVYLIDESVTGLWRMTSQNLLKLI